MNVRFSTDSVSRRSLLLCTAGLWPASRLLLGGQAQQPPPTYSAGVKVVNVFATVRDKDGRIVRNLTQDDFMLEEDGRPQVIRYFAQQSDLPLTLGLLVDTSGSERRMIGVERDASETFLDTVLRPEKDRAFLIHFDREVELLQDLTSSRQRLEKALDLLQTADRPQFANGGGQPGAGGGGWGGRGGWGRQGGGYPGGGRRRGGGTAFFDAVYLAADEIMKKQQGRKALIMLTDGEDNASKVSITEAISAAQRADTLGYSIRIYHESGSGGFSGPGFGRRGGFGRGPAMNRPDGKKILEQISKETGGGYFEVSKKEPLSDIYSQIEEELRSQYSLGYTPDRTDQAAGFRKIQVSVKQKGLVVRARDGYYAAA